MKVLIVSEFIAPLNAIASIRWTKLGKYLAKNYSCTIDVLTNEKDFTSKGLWATRGIYDKTLAADLKWFNNYLQFKNSSMVKITNALRNVLKDLQDKNRAMSRKTPAPVKEAPLRNSTSFVDRVYPVFLKLRENSFVKKALKANVDWGQYDVIVSSFSPKWTHLAAKRLKNEYPKVVWLADYRDALVYSRVTDTQANRKFASNATGNASCISAVSSHTLTNLFLEASTDTMVLPNGYDESELVIRERKLNKKFVVSYTGTLYNAGDAVSNLTPIFVVLDELITEGKVDRDSIDFVYCGASEDFFSRQANSFPDIPRTNLGVVQRKDALSLQDKSSILVLCSWNTPLSQDVITGKVFEYFTSSVPIACLCSGSVPNSKIKEMIEDSRTGYCYEEANGSHDLPELKQFILDKYNQWKESGLTFVDADWSYIESFSYSNLANKLYEKIETLRQPSESV